MRLKRRLNIRKVLSRDDIRMAPSLLELPPKCREQAEIVQYARPQVFDNSALQVDCLFERSFHSVDAIQGVLAQSRFDASYRLQIHDCCSHQPAQIIVQLM